MIKNKKYIRNLAFVFKHIKNTILSLFDFMYTYLHLQYPDCSHWNRKKSKKQHKTVMSINGLNGLVFENKSV